MLEATTQKVDRSAVRHPNGNKVARSFADRPCQHPFFARFDVAKKLLQSTVVASTATFAFTFVSTPAAIAFVNTSAIAVSAGSGSGHHYKQRAKYQVESTFHEPLGTKIKEISATL